MNAGRYRDCLRRANRGGGRLGRWLGVPGLLLILVLSGCARGAVEQAATADGPVDLEKRKQTCINLLRDARLWCRKNLQDDINPARYNCLDARIKLDRYCY